MKITTKSNFSIFEIIIESNNTRIVEDVANFSKCISKDLTNDLISAALDAYRFQGKSDLDFIQDILNNHTCESVKDQLES